MGKTTFSGPASGAYVILPVFVGTLADTESDSHTVKLPAGMKVKPFAAVLHPKTTAATTTVGILIGGTSVASTTSFTAATDTLVEFSSIIEAESTDIVVITACSGGSGAVADLVVLIYAYVTSHSTTL